MHTVAAEIPSRVSPWSAATEPVDTIHNYNIPIQPYQRSPYKNNPQPNSRRKPQPQEQPAPKPETGHEGGLVDDYA